MLGFIPLQLVVVVMSDRNHREGDRPVTARGYKGPKWLIDRLPRVSGETSDDS